MGERLIAALGLDVEPVGPFEPVVFVAFDEDEDDAPGVCDDECSCLPDDCQHPERP